MAASGDGVSGWGRTCDSGDGLVTGLGEGAAPTAAVMTQRLSGVDTTTIASMHMCDNTPWSSEGQGRDTEELVVTGGGGGAAFLRCTLTFF